MTAAHLAPRLVAPERRVLRIGAACAIAGPPVALVANIVHPRPSISDVGDAEAFLRLAADSSVWLPVHLALVLAFILFLGGLAALSYSLYEERGAWFARLALAAAVAGTAVNIVRTAVDTAIGEIAKDWAAAPPAEKPAALRAGTALEEVDFTMFALNVALFYGVTFILYGIALSTSDRYPRWLGWLAIVTGLGHVIAAVTQAFTGPSVVTVVVFPVLAAVFALWLLAIGALLWRQTAAAQA